MNITGVDFITVPTQDFDRAQRFYGEVLGLEVFAREAGRHVFFRCGPGMLLVFDPARTMEAAGQVGGVPVPRHGAVGAGHACFRIAEGELAAWRERLVAQGVAIEAEIAWPRGGTSLYVRDPAGNSVELAPARIWGLGPS